VRTPSLDRLGSSRGAEAPLLHRIRSVRVACTAEVWADNRRCPAAADSDCLLMATSLRSVVAGQVSLRRPATHWHVADGVPGPTDLLNLEHCRLGWVARVMMRPACRGTGPGAVFGDGVAGWGR
jgi:hypothetical protein